MHENAFLRRYVADVLADNEAIPRAVAAAGMTDIAALRDDPPPAVLVLSDAVDGAERWMDEAEAHDVAVLLLQPARLAVRRVVADRVMRTPFSGFQVAEAVAELIHERERRPRDGDGA